MNNLAIRLGDLGRHDEGLEVITEAVRIRRNLAHIRPEACLPDLAMSLNNLAARLGALGRYQEGLEAITSAVAIYRDQVRELPTVHQPALDRSLKVLIWLRDSTQGNDDEPA